ncbi:MAG: dihydrodipicolinate synthase family protein [Sphaerochaetaceae bacterium]
MAPKHVPHGVYVSLITPFRDDLVAYDLLIENLKKLNATDIDGYLVLGGNSESYGMTELERLKIISTVKDNLGTKQIIAGVAAESTHLALEEIAHLHQWGVDYVRVLPPHYFAKNMDQETIQRFYNEVADNSPVPVILYHVPRLSNGIEFSASLVGSLAKHQNIVGIKDSSPDGIYGFIGATKHMADFAVLSGSANSFFPAMVAGAAGGDMTLANYMPRHCCQLYDEFKKGNLERAKELHFALYTVNKLVSGRLGIPGIKAAMNIMGFNGGEPRRPILSLGKPEEEKLKDTLNHIFATFDC